MSIGDINGYGWAFVTSLVLIALGLGGWYLNRSMVELQMRLKRGDGTPEYSYLQQWLLPKYRTGAGRMANEEFHGHVDTRAKGRIAGVSLLVLAAGFALQVVLWIYLSNFVDGPVSFLKQTG